ncbi:MAG: FecCD family ABC transporter permease, partial [Phycisphaeraceae bacterium]
MADEASGFGGGRLALVLVAGAVLSIAAGLIQLMAGAYGMSAAEAWAALTDPAVWGQPRVLAGYLLGDGLATSLVGQAGQADELPTATLVVWNVRLPRVIVGALVGVNLALSGAIFQAVTRNELASPFILGVSGGAGLAVLVVLVLASHLVMYLPLIAALGGAAAFAAVYAIAWKGGTSPIRLVLAGVIVGTLCGSLQTSVFYAAEDLAVVKSAIAWTTGSLMGAGWREVRMVVLWTLLAAGLAIGFARQLNVLLLGERTARALGMPVERVRFGLSAVAILAAGAAISVSGLVGFVGLIVPHIVRNLVGSDYRRLLVGCLAAGPALLLVSDMAARLALSPTQMPVGVVTGLLGGPYFLYLMRRR